MAKAEGLFLLGLVVISSLVMLTESRLARKDLGIDLGGIGIGLGVGLGIGLGGGSGSGAGAGNVVGDENTSIGWIAGMPPTSW